MAKHFDRAYQPKRALSPDDVEIIYGIPRGTLANLRSKRVGCVFWKVGSKCYYRADEFERWFFSHKILTKDSI